MKVQRLWDDESRRSEDHEVRFDFPARHDLLSERVEIHESRHERHLLPELSPMVNTRGNDAG
jgi:hypothetical protein